jgi:hypothetical protein
MASRTRVGPRFSTVLFTVRVLLGEWVVAIGGQARTYNESEAVAIPHRSGCDSNPWPRPTNRHEIRAWSLLIPEPGPSRRGSSQNFDQGESCGSHFTTANEHNRWAEIASGWQGADGTEPLATALAPLR